MKAAPPDGRTVGLAAGSLSALAWGSAFPVLAFAMTYVHPLWVSAIRFAIALPVLAAILAYVEGRKALGFGGRFWSLFLAGAGGIAGYNILALAGMKMSSATHGALMFATIPLMVAIASSVRTRMLPSPATVICSIGALCGVALVITGGSLAALEHGASLAGDGLLFLGSAAFVGYTLERAKFADLSALRFTWLTMVTAEIAIVAIAAGSTAFAPFPAGHSLETTGWSLAYAGIVPVVGAILLYNVAVTKLGPAQAALFANLVPLVTIGIEFARGIRLSPIEYLGAAIALAALVANTLLAAPHEHRSLFQHHRERIA